jgi:hypothetical protein
MSERWTRETALLKAFELAHRLCPQRSAALAVTRRAWATLNVAVTAQSKRLYYRPRRRPLRSKVFLGEAHLLQRLVCAEAEKAATADTQSEFTVLFLVAVVRRALARNSFHTALAVTRVLHDYSTREGMLLYKGLVRDLERVRAEDYWRSRKRQLMSELLQCFGNRVELTRAGHGEDRFAAVDSVGPLLTLVRETLVALTPWNTSCIVPKQLDSSPDGFSRLAWAGDAAEDQREVQRMHALVHPLCFKRLVGAAGLDAPAARLSIPRLLWAKEDDGDVGRRSPRPLEKDEREALLTEMEDLSRRRRKAPNMCLSVLVDGVERCRIEPERDATCRIVLGPNAANVDVVTWDAPEGDPLPLAWLPLEREAATEELRPLRRQLTLEGGQRLTFVVTNLPADDPDILPIGEVFVRYQETAITRVLALGLRRLRIRALAWPRWSLLRSACAALAGLGLAVMVFREAPRPTPTSRSMSVQAVSPPSSETVTAQPPPSPPPDPRPADRVTRTPVEGPTRAFTSRYAGVGLAEVHVLWLSLAHDAPKNSVVVQRIEQQLAASGFALSKLPEEADGALEIELIETPTVPDADDPEVRWSLRVVNAEGSVLWPASGSPRNYRGRLSRTISRMTRELDAVLVAAREPRTRRSDRP